MITTIKDYELEDIGLFKDLITNSLTNMVDGKLLTHCRIVPVGANIFENTRKTNDKINISIGEIHTKYDWLVVFKHIERYLFTDSREYRKYVANLVHKSSQNIL